MSSRTIGANPEFIRIMKMGLISKARLQKPSLWVTFSSTRCVTVDQ